MDKKILLLQVIPKQDTCGAETGRIDVAKFIVAQNYYSAILCSGGEQVKDIDQTKVKIFIFPVHSKNPLFILFNIFLLITKSAISISSQRNSWHFNFTPYLTSYINL